MTQFQVMSLGATAPRSEVAVRDGDPNPRGLLVAASSGVSSQVVHAVCARLTAIQQGVMVSRAVGESPEAPRLIVVIDGWGSLALRDALERCEASWAGCPTLAVLARRGLNVAAALEAGATDCVRWPTGSDELTARVRARLSLARGSETPLIALDSRRSTIRCHGVRANLTPGQFQIVNELLRQPARWMTSKELMKTALLSSRKDTTQVRVHVHAIRRKLRHEAWRLRGDRGLGYFFEVSSVRDDEHPALSKSGTSPPKKLTIINGRSVR